MNPISLFINTPEIKKKRTSERAELVRLFVERLKDKNGKPFRPAFIGMKLSHVRTDELYFLFKECERAEKFGAKFWFLIQGKK